MSEKYIWEDPMRFKVNKEDGHAIAMPYDNVDAAVSQEQSPYKQSLNGMWKFYWQRGLENQPAKKRHHSPHRHKKPQKHYYIAL